MHSQTPASSATAPTRRRRARGLLVAAALATAPLATAGRAHAEELSPTERARLARGETVTRAVTIEGEDRRYVGGLTYAVIDASVSELQEIFEDVASYRHLLPRTKRATLVDRVAQDDLVELRQGTAMIEARYTLRVRHEPWRREVHFWLVPSRPHDVRDAWGYFHVDPVPPSEGATGPRSLVTYAVLVDLGPGLVRDLFEERLRTVLLSTPDILRRYIAARHSPPRQG
ncbi:MAG: SRPBCC family protein [Myxococcales bacterium]|nr:SRPBCC family protein [Myxococcales bacterium]